MSKCWFTTVATRPTAVISLGRYGDCILLLPALREIGRRTGVKPVMFISTQFSNLLDGVSYVTPHVLNIGWLDVAKARKMAAAYNFEEIIIPKWWDDPQGIKPEYRGNYALQYQGRKRLVDVRKFPNYMTSQWECCGFSPEDIFALPLVFDLRSHAREASLVRQLCPRLDKPIIAYNFQGITSPFGYVPEVLNTIKPRFGRTCRFIDMGGIRAHRIYDLLGIMDAASIVISSDTATGHLATASPTPHALFIADGWGGSVPRGNCGFYCRYGETLKKLPQLVAWIESTLASKAMHTRSPELAVA